jgi:hypothetical protein
LHLKLLTHKEQNHCNYVHIFEKKNGSQAILSIIPNSTTPDGKKKYLLKCIVKLFEIELFFFCYCFIAETALLLPAALSKNRHENDTSDIRRNLRLRYRDLYKHNRDNE